MRVLIPGAVSVDIVNRRSGELIMPSEKIDERGFFVAVLPDDAPDYALSIRYGHNENISYNHGVEGETDDEEVLFNREYTSKALLASLFLSNGTPMLLAGDEFGNSQQGNNNSYCQDNPITWLDWQNESHVLQSYTQELIRVRSQIKLLTDDCWWEKERMQWLNADSSPMTEYCWHNRGSKAIQIVLDDEWLLLVNAKRSRQLFNLPQGNWEISCVPSEKLNYEEPGKCVVEHMGIWILHKIK